MIPAPEFSRPFALDRLGAAAAEETVTATPAECAALALRLDIPSVKSLSCRWRLHRSAGGRVDAEGKLSARLVRVCVITLDEFTVDAGETFKVAFVPAGKESDDPDPEAVDEVPYDGTAIDLGEAAAEQLALSLDPYPHKPGAALPRIGEEPESRSPFAALARRSRES